MQKVGEQNRYINLDFAYLVELSTLDMYIREHIIRMCLDIEHCLKVKLLSDIENNSNEDGYKIVNDFLNSSGKAYIIKDIDRKSNSAYCGGLIQHYFKYTETNGIYDVDCPVWAFLEVVSFGSFIDLYNFYCQQNDIVNKAHASAFRYVRSLRNACAHNNCILHDLRPDPASTTPSSAVRKFVEQIPTIGKDMRSKKLTNRFILEFVGLLYLYTEIVSEEIKHHRIEELKAFFNGRLQKNMGYFQTNAIICTNFEFLKKVVDFL